MHHATVLVVDASDAPLAALPKAEVLRQGLLHRRILVLSPEADERLAMRCHDGLWQSAAAGIVLATEGAEDAAWRCLPPQPSPPEFHLLTVLAPSPRLRAFVWVFIASQKLELPEATPMDHEEISALIRRYRELVAPEFTHAWEAGALLLQPHE